MMDVKIKGKRGSWFAYAGGEWLPCVHAHRWVGKDRYRDPHIDLSIPKHAEFVDAIKELRKVIVTKDNVLDEATRFERTDYVGVFSVAFVTVTGTVLEFQFLERLEEAA